MLFMWVLWSPGEKLQETASEGTSHPIGKCSSSTVAGDGSKEGGSQSEKAKAEREETTKASLGVQEAGEIHGDWLVVSRRKRPILAQRDQAKNKWDVLLSNRYEKIQSNSKVVGHVGDKDKGSTFNVRGPTSHNASPSASKSTKSSWRIKKRRRDEGPTIQSTPTFSTNVKVVVPRPPT